VHIVTVNDYLASPRRRVDGRSAPLPRPDGRRQPVADAARGQKQAAYAADITYGTNNEFGFDYLRDNMVYAAKERVQRGSATPSSTRSTRS
jgi:preprotein translocase subunit SecA